jgi:hypothetical protein
VPSSRRPWSAVPTLVVAVAALAGVVLGSVACVQPVGPARTAEDYQLKAKDTAETVLSSVRTASLAVDVAERDRAFPPYVSVVLSDAEDEAGGAVSTFDSVQPPGRSSDRLREQLGDLLDRAESALSAARIAARRVDDDALAAQAAPLDEVATDLEAFIGDVTDALGRP